MRAPEPVIEFPTCRRSRKRVEAPIRWCRHSSASPRRPARPIIERISAELKRVMALPEVIDKYVQGGLVPAYSTPTEFEARVRGDVDRFAKLVMAIGMQPQ